MDIYYVSLHKPHAGALVRFVVGQAADHYGLLIFKEEEVVKLQDCLMIDKKWLVVTPVGVIWANEHDFFVI